MSDRKIIIECANCHTRFEEDICGEHHLSTGDNDYAGVCIGLVICVSCAIPILFEQNTERDFNSDMDYGPPKTIYPTSSLNVNNAAPEPIRIALEEAIVCFKVKAYTASAIMCRKVLEGIRSEYGIKERTLSASLNTMKEREFIDIRLFQWSDALKSAGNEAAHDVNIRIEKDDAQDIVDFAVAITDYLFSFRQRFDEFQRRRKERPKTVDET